MTLRPSLLIQSHPPPTKKQEDLTFLDAKSAEMADKLEKTLAGEVQHRVREQFVRWLDAAVAQVSL